MVNKSKIILMTKLAIYDKRHGEADRDVFSFFRRDYIYRKNMWTRLCVFCCSMLLLGIYWLQQIFVEGIDIQQINIEQSVRDSVLFLGAVLAFYTLVGTIQGTRQYYLVQKRMNQYTAMLHRLENIPDAQEESETPLLYTEDRSNRPRKRRT